MSILPLSYGIIESIHSICKRFIPQIACSEMCKPKEEGGLSFRDLRAWNQELSAIIAYLG